MRLNNILWKVWVCFLTAGPVYSAESSNHPYIDQLLQQIHSKDHQESSESYTEKLRQQLEQESPAESSQGYTERLRASDPKHGEPDPSALYTEKEKAKLEPHEEESAIQSVIEGKSELEPKFKGNIHHAFGLRYGASLIRNFTADASTQANNFNDIYGLNYAPDVSLFYEFQPFHSEWYGNIGFFGMLGLAYFNGQGRFAFALSKPSGGTFPLLSQVHFQFYTVPVTVGANYRFNLMRILRPYVFLGPTAIGWTESRSDGQTGFRGYSFGVTGSVGAAISLDWISSGSKWNLYTEHGIKHYYLTVDYTQLSTFSGSVNFSVNGLTAGITFEI
jgi:hypothetical protein